MHKGEEERRVWRARQLDQFINDCEQHIAAQIDLVVELRRRRVDVTKYTERIHEFEKKLQSRIQERDLLIDRSSDVLGGDQIHALASKIAGLGAIRRP